MKMMSLSGLLTFLIFLSTLSTASGLGSVLSRDWKHETYYSTWKNAQNICRRYNNDLATIYTKTQAKDIYLKRYLAWIGLHKESSTKDWIWTDGEKHMVDWGYKQPDNNEDCAAIGYHNYNTRKVYSIPCERKQFFACQRNSIPGFHFIMEAKNWYEADTYCTDHHNGLASFDMSNMNYFSQQDIPTWIGLHRNGGSWKWSSGLEEDKQWNLAEPNNDKNCVAITSVNKWLTTQNCQTLLPFLCMKDNLVLVKENRSWEEAFEHCRSLGLSSNSGLHFNLLSVQPGDEHTYVKNKVMEADTEEVWTGLRYLGDEWLWVNGADMLYTGLPQCPILWQRCGALSKNDTGTMEARDCLERKNFLCYSYKP